MKKILAILIIFSFSTTIFSQSFIKITGAKATGIGKNGLCIKDIWSAYNNQALLSFLENKQIGINYENYWGLKELSNKTLAFALPNKYISSAITYNYFGYQLFNQQSFGIALSKKIHKQTAIGIRINTIHTQIERGYRHQTNLFSDLSFYSKISEKTYLGTQISNIIGNFIKTNTSLQIPTIFQIGLLNQFNKKGNIHLALEKQLNHEVIFKTGIEYILANKLWIQLGIISSPIQNTFGFGYQHRQYQINIASIYHPIIGYSYQSSITINLK